jgi:hypothetical protein
MNTKAMGQEWRDKRRAEGRCCSCSVSFPPPGKRQCGTCAEKRRARDRKRYKAGFCGCGEPRPKGKATCAKCKLRATKWMAIPENKERTRLRTNARNAGIRVEVMSAYGNKCVCCGESGLPFLTIDHIGNDGKSDRAQYATTNWYRLIRKMGFPKHLQILCWNCNMAKQHYGGGVCPHQLMRKAALTPKRSAKP